jgi:multidrug efflux pump
VPRFHRQTAGLPELRDVASDQQNGRPAGALVIDRSTASRFGITPQMIDDTLYDAFGQRQISIMFTQLNQYRVVLEVKPSFSRIPTRSEATSISVLGQRRSSAQRLHAFEQAATAPLVVNHQGQFPVVTVSFNLAPGASLGDAVERGQSRAKKN